MKHRPTSNTNGVYMKFNMADSKPEIVIALVILWIEMQFQVLFKPYFQGSAIHSGTFHNFRFGDRHIEFNIYAVGTRRRVVLLCIGDHGKHGISVWNRISIYNTTKVISTSGFGSPY